MHRVVLLMQAAMGRNHVDPTRTKYLGSIVAVLLNIALVLGILGYCGIQTASLGEGNPEAHRSTLSIRPEMAAHHWSPTITAIDDVSQDGAGA